MEKINFVNGQEPALNGTNLNQLQTNVEEAVNEVDEKVIKLEGIELYNSTGNSATTITLSDDISNYKFVEIYYKFVQTNNGNAMGNFYTKGVVGETLNLSSSTSGYFADDSSYGTRIFNAKVSIKGNTLTKAVGYSFTFKVNNTVVFHETLNETFITKVIGYK